MTLFDPYSHSRVHELRQEQLARKAHLLEKLGLDALAHLSGDVSARNRVATAFARITGRRSEEECPPAGAARPALDSRHRLH